MKMIYAIGDIHGMVNKLERLYDKILLDIKVSGVTDATIIFLGDYIDRGPCSKEVLDFLMDVTPTDVISHVFLKGNHESMMVDSYKNPSNLAMRNVWLSNGGIEGLDSFGHSNTFNEFLEDKSMVPYIKWMDSLILKYKVDDYVFVHAGYSRYASYENQIEEHLLWMRCDNYYQCEFTVVHGHTPKHYPVDKPRQINVDTGANWGDASELTAVALMIPRDDTNENSRRFISTT